MPQAACAGFLSLLLAACLAFSQAPDQPDPTRTIKVSTVVVNIFAVVEDAKGRPVPGLRKEDFTVTEDDLKQETRYFARNTEAPLTLGIVVDTSPSQESVLGIEREHAKTLIQRLVRSSDLAFVLHFDRQIELLQDLTADQQLLAHAIDAAAIDTGWDTASPSPQHHARFGGTHLYDALYLASNELMKSQTGRKVLVLLTDGQDQGSDVKAEAALAAAQKASVIIYSIAISDNAFYAVRDLQFHGNSVLKKFATATGGRTIPVDSRGAMSAAIKQIAEEVRGQYLLGYTPPKQRDGAFHRIRVTVRGCKCRVRARRGYYSEPE